MNSSFNSHNKRPKQNTISFLDVFLHVHSAIIARFFVQLARLDEIGVDVRIIKLFSWRQLIVIRRWLQVFLILIFVFKIRKKYINKHFKIIYNNLCIWTLWQRSIVRLMLLIVARQVECLIVARVRRRRRQVECLIVVHVQRQRCSRQINGSIVRLWNWIEIINWKVLYIKK